MYYSDQTQRKINISSRHNITGRQHSTAGGARSTGTRSSGSGRRSSAHTSPRSSQRRNSGRNRIISNAEKQALKDKRIRAMRRKKARQRAYTYRAIVFGFCALCIFLVWKGVTGITSYIDNSRQQAVNAMQNIDINKGNSSIDVAGETMTAETSPSTTVVDTSDPTHVLSNGRYVDTTKPMIALTWDDGPNGSTGEKIMDVLEAYNGRGTFFIVGDRIDQFASEVQRMAANGHEIANHSWDHDESLSKKDASYIQDEFNKVNAKVQELTGVTPTLARLPGGIISDAVKSSITMPLIFWSVDTTDWKYRDASHVSEIIKSEVKDGDIILMHELYQSTQEACEQVIPWLAQQGYQLVTVSELIQFRNAEVVGGNGVQYSSFPPTETVAETTAAESVQNDSASHDTSDNSSNSGNDVNDVNDDDSGDDSSEETKAVKKSTTAADEANDSSSDTDAGSGKSESNDDVIETAEASQESSNTDEIIEAPDDSYTPTEAQAAQTVTETAWWMAITSNNSDSGSPVADGAQDEAIQAIDAPG